MRFALLLALVTLVAARPAFAGLQELKSAAKKPPASASAGLELAAQLRVAGLVSESMQVAQRSLAKATDAEMQARLRLEQVRDHLLRGEMHQALALCEQMKQASPLLRQVCIAESHLSFRRGSLALEAANAALAIDPDDYDARLAKARALRISGDTEQAVKLFQDVIQKDSTRPEAYPFLAQLQLDLGKNDAAVATLRQALKVGSQDAVPRVLLARELPAGDEAVKLATDALDLREGYVDAYAVLGLVQLELGKLDEAERALRKALAISPQNVATNAALAQVFLSRGDADAAIKQARLTLKLMASDGDAKLVEADALALKGETDLAIEAYQAAFGLARQNPDVLIHAARSCLKLGRPTTAAAFAERGTEDFPEWAPSWVALGDVKAGSDPESARKAYQQALAKKGPIDRAEIERKIAALK